jgi:hypothetical protein
MPGHCHQVAGDQSKGGIRGTAYSPTNQKRLGCDVTVGSQPLELREFHGSSYLACCHGSPGSKAGST